MRLSRLRALGARGFRRLARDAPRAFSGWKVPGRVRLEDGAQIDHVSVRAVPVHVCIIALLDEPSYLDRALRVRRSHFRHLGVPRLAFRASDVQFHPDGEVRRDQRIVSFSFGFRRFISLRFRRLRLRFRRLRLRLFRVLRLLQSTGNAIVPSLLSLVAPMVVSGEEIIFAIGVPLVDDHGLDGFVDGFFYFVLQLFGLHVEPLHNFCERLSVRVELERSVLNDEFSEKRLALGVLSYCLLYTSPSPRDS